LSDEQEKGMIQKNQCLAIDKLVKTKGKVAEAPEAEVDPAVKEVVLDQMDQWTEMIERHRYRILCCGLFISCPFAR
jgi:hypothetical protein